MFGPTLTPIDFGSGGVAPSYDTDAQAYITAVEAADSQSLETGVKDAINAFVVGCKADGIWTAMVDCAILAGARTLSGILIPLKGTTPTNNNFVSGDYSRTTGLIGDGSTKYLLTGSQDDDYPQDDYHQGCYVTTLGTAGDVLAVSAANLRADSTTRIESNFFRLRSNNITHTHSTAGTAGFVGFARTSSTAGTARMSGVTDDVTQNSAVVDINVDRTVFCISASSVIGGPYAPGNYYDGRIAFYSLGTALDLALLDSRVTTLIAGFTFAINTGLSPVGYSTETINYVNAGYAAGGTLA